MTNKNKPDISVVIPVYNEKDSISILFNEVLTSLKKIGKSFEIIVVDDGSTDGTDLVLKKLHPIHAIILRRNSGQASALETGIQHSTGEIIITLDGDGQNDPKDFQLLLDKLSEGYDAVCGWRHQRNDSPSKVFISRGAKALRDLLIDDGVHDAGCTLRAYNRYCFEDVHIYGELHRMIPALLRLSGFKLAEVKVNHRPRRHGITKYNLKRVANGFLDMIQVWISQKYGQRPLYLYGSIGLFLITTSSILLALLAFSRLFLGYSLSDKIWPLVGMFGFMTGIQLLIFGIIADLIIKNNKKWLSSPVKSVHKYE